MSDVEVKPVQENIPAATSLFDQSEELTKKVRERAYQLFGARGCQHGRDVEDWCQAEREVLGARGKEEQSQSPIPKSTSAVPSKSAAASGAHSD